MRVNGKAEEITNQMRQHSLTLRMEYVDGHERWCLSNGARVEKEVAHTMLRVGAIVADCDALFASVCLSQTYRARNALNSYKDFDP